ncbi:MAG: glycoside hydrolase family 88 protein [Blautia sp.]
MRTRKSGTRALSLLIVLCMIVSMIPSYSFAAGSDTSSNTTLTAALEEAKSYIDGLTVDSTVNDPETVVSTWGKEFSWDNEKRESNSKDFLYEWSYYNGVVFEGIEQVYSATGENKYSDYVLKYLQNMVNNDGSWAKTSDGTHDAAGYIATYGLDCYKTATLLLDYAILSGDSRYETLADSLYSDLKNAQNKYTGSDIGGNYNHTWSSTPDYKVWLDGLYMAQPFMAEYAVAKNDTDEIANIVNRLTWVSENMYNSDTGLFYHAANSATDNSQSYWLRAVGWYAAALVDVIDELQAGNYTDQAAVLSAQLKMLVDGMAQYQDNETGMWRNYVLANDTSDNNRLETSGTALMSYAIMKAVNNEVLNISYADMAVKAFKGICDNKLNGNKLSDICFKGSPGASNNVFKEDEGKGVGPFIMAYAQMLTYNQNHPETSAPSEALTDEVTGIVISGSEAEEAIVVDRSNDESVKSAVADKLSKYVAYDITLEGYTEGTEATVSIPVPEGFDTANLKVYYVADDGTVEDMGGSYADGSFIFTTTHFSTYVLGEVAVAGADTKTGTLESGYTYELDTNGVDDGAIYLIVSSNSGTAYALRNNSGTDAVQLVSFGENTASVAAHESDCLWTASKNGNSYTLKNGDNYIRTGNNNVITTQSTNLSITQNDKGYYIKGSSSSYYLTYNNSNGWTRNNSKYTVYLYKQTSAGNGESVSFSIAEPNISLNKDAAATLTPTVTVDGTVTDNYNITYETSDGNVATVDSNGKITAVGKGSTTITATLTKANDVSVIPDDRDMTITINVTVNEVTVTNGTVTGSVADVAINGTPDYSGITLEVVYSDGSTATIPYTELSFSDVDTSSLGTKTVTVSYQGVEYGTVSVKVSGDPFAGLPEADPSKYPEYPADGAVRIDKNAVADTQTFEKTGVAHVELTTAGVSVKTGVDVILVTDLSNSMAWEAGTRENASTETESKVYSMKQSVAAFADTLLADNEDGTKTDNTVSLVTFGGYDADNTTTKVDGYADAAQILLTGSNNADTVKNIFNNIKLWSDSTSGGTGYKLSFDGGVTSGWNYGNTNYDHAFMQTADAISNLKANYKSETGSNYDDSGREIYVLFMTDGAPSNYEGVYYAYKTGARADVYCQWDTGNGTKSTYQMGNNGTNYTAEQWYEYISSTDLTWATKVFNTTNVADIYTVGFDLANGGFSSMTFTEEDGRPLKSVLQSIVKGEENLPVYEADNSDDLKNIYASLATKIKYAGTNAVVTDTLKSDVTLQMASVSGTIEGKQATLDPKPVITVTAYDLYTKADFADPNSEDAKKLIGTRKGPSTVLEKVEFNDAGTEATSDKVDGNIMTSEDGIVTITAQYFTYTKDASGVEKFVWNIGNITDKEVALAYDVYLKGSLEGDCSKGLYDTNEAAVLEYVDINGCHATQTFPVPSVAWGGAATAYEFYLVNANGDPVNHAGEVIPFANRIIVRGPYYETINLNEDMTVEAKIIKAIDVLPNGYFLYDDNAWYSVQTTSSNETVTGSLTISDPSADASSVKGGVQQSGAQTTKAVSFDEQNYTQSRVAFGVRYDMTPEYLDTSLEGDTIVLDYGKAIQKDVLANDTLPEKGTVSYKGYSMELVGFTAYNPNADMTQMQSNPGEETYKGNAGTFSIVDGKVNYKLENMLSGIEKVFCVVRISGGDADSEGNPTDVFYMYEELDIIPATSVYYETDFVDGDGVFKTSQKEEAEAWKTVTDSDVGGSQEADDPIQNDGTVLTGVKPYGYDSTYDDDTRLSDGSSMFVEGAGRLYTTVEFSFTGTGFDLISRTGNEQGQIYVQIFRDEAKNDRVKAVTVLNKSETGLELYQIPVFSINGLDYGTYYVTVGVNASYTNESNPELSRGNEFYFDAVRVFDPINASANADATTDSGLAYKAYASDGEADAYVQEVRSIMLDSTTYDSEIDGASKVLFVDRTYKTDSEGVDIGTYEAIGPNNEVYLSKDQGIAFKVSGSVPASIDIGAKSADGSPVQLFASFDSVEETTEDGESGESYPTYGYSFDVEIKSCTAQYYDIMRGTGDGDSSISEIMGSDGAYVTIYNIGEGILSITDIKIAYGTDTGTTEISVDDGTLSNAKRVMSVSSSEEEKNYDILSAAFENNSYRLQRDAILIVTSSADVEKLDVINNGSTVKITKTEVTTNSEGQKVWNLTLRTTRTGKQTYTVVGYGEDGTSGASVDAVVIVTRK